MGLVLVLDVVLVLAGLVLLAVLGLRVWRQVRELGRAVATAGERVAEATDALAAVAPAPHSATDGPRHAAS